MWSKYFKLKGLVPGKVVTHSQGTVDFRNPNLPIEKLQKLFEEDFPYLEITPEGQRVLYGKKTVTPKTPDPTQDEKPAPPMNENTYEQPKQETKPEQPKPRKVTYRKRKKPFSP